MSENESASSSETLYQMPSSVGPGTPGELEPERESLDLGVSPEFTGPRTRSGRKRKHPAPVKSSGKKKNKMTSRLPLIAKRTSSLQTADPSSSPSIPRATAHTRDVQPQQLPAVPPQDIAKLLADGLGMIQRSMEGMESRLSGKMDLLESSVKQNKDTIVLLTDSVNKNAVDLARLESQFREANQSFERRVMDVVRTGQQQGGMGPHASSSFLSSTDRMLTPEQTSRYWRCRRSLRLWPVKGPDLLANTLEFLSGQLGMDEEAMATMTDMVVTRIVEPRSKIQSKVLVEFPSVPVRDSVKASGYKLEGVRAGIRIEIPNVVFSCGSNSALVAPVRHALYAMLSLFKVQ